MDVKEDQFRKKMHLGQDGNTLVQLIVANAVLFVILKFVYVMYQVGQHPNGPYFTEVYNWFALPASPAKLATRPWTLLTFMFSDFELMRFVSNLFWLYSFGYILQDLTGNRKLIAIYLFGGLAGAIVFILSYQVFPELRDQAALASFSGANCAIAAIAIATTTVSPDYRIFPMISGGIPLWVLTLVFLMFDFSGIGHGDSAGYLANAAAAGCGFLFIYQLRRGRDGSLWINQFFDWLNDLFNPEKKKKKTDRKDEFYYQVSGTQPYKKIPNITQKRIDEILDKINQQGFRFLTNEEKEILRRAAEEEDL